jgi:hypothetical protein
LNLAICFNFEIFLANLNIYAIIILREGNNRRML